MKLAFGFLLLCLVGATAFLATTLRGGEEFEMPLLVAQVSGPAFEISPKTAPTLPPLTSLLPDKTGTTSQASDKAPPFPDPPATSSPFTTRSTVEFQNRSATSNFQAQVEAPPPDPPSFPDADGSWHSSPPTARIPLQGSQPPGRLQIESTGDRVSLTVRSAPLSSVLSLL